MQGYHTKKIAVFLITVIIVNVLAISLLGSTPAEAGFWDENKGGLITVIKGLVMLWIINLMRQNSTGDGGDDLITSTIKKGLNLDLEKATDDAKVDNSDSNSNSYVVETTDTVTGLTEREYQMVELVNQTRMDMGLGEVNIDLRLVKVARKKAQDMIANNYFEHQSPLYGSPFDMLRAEGINYSLAGENLAGARTIEEAFSSLMKSPNHKDNILKSRYDQIGVAVIEGGPYGLMVVQLFIDSPDPTQ